MRINLRDEKVIQATPAQIWPILSDTATMNRKMGLPPMSFKTIEGIRHGEQKMAGITIRWTEAPWEWKQNEWLKNTRVYSSGFFKSISGHFEITPLSPEQSKVSVQFSIDHKYGFFASLLNKATQNVLKNILNEVEKGVKEAMANSEATLPAQGFAQWLETLAPVQRARIAPKFAAMSTDTDWQNILRTSLGPSMKGRFGVLFDAICPHCRGAKQSFARLTDMPTQVECESCDINFTLGAQESIEISLRDNSLPSDQLAMDFCSADVTHKPTMVYQRLGGNWMDGIILPEGAYLLKRKGESRAITLMIDQSAERRLLDLDEMWHEQAFAPLRAHPELGLRTKALPIDGLIMIEQLEQSRGALSATEVLLYPEFSEFIPLESLATGFPLEMGRKALMFTDVVGSTDLYHRVGDSAAFRKVRESFIVIGNAVRKHDGVLVKTIGDATMFAFANAESALKAAIDIQHANKNEELKLRASLHYGPCLSVSTNHGQDFFGDTVNICAKFQSEAEAGQIVFEEGMHNELSSEFKKELEGQLTPVSFKLKGESGRAFQLYRITI